MGKHQEGLGEFSSHTRFEVGVGSKIKFWHDVWCGDHILKEAFQSYSVLLDLRKLLCLIKWNFLVTLISGRLILLERCMTGRWISLPRSLICCTPLD